MKFSKLALMSLAAAPMPVFGTGCYSAWRSGGDYSSGDIVSAIVPGTTQTKNYKCISGSQPSHSHCPSYDPSNSLQASAAWSDQGVCSGPLPTPAGLNGCPEAFDTSAEYEANDKVSIKVSDTHSAVWQCSSDVHQSRFCPQFEPENDSKLGWKFIGYCNGIMPPSISPNFSDLEEVGDGCPEPYNAAVIYEQGDAVSVPVSSTPYRVVVYTCKAWPYNAFCNAGPNFAPDSDNANLGWTLKGHCEGTISPTSAPIVADCKWYNGTRPITINSWAKEDVSTYVPGTRVRKGRKIYKCRGWPYGLWCGIVAYEPEKHTYWTDAWAKAGDCMDLATVSPTKRPIVFPTSPRTPTSSPSTSLTNSPSKSPSTSPTSPSASLTISPSASPSNSPSKSPSTSPTSPSASPTISPSASPSNSPSKSPSTSPTSPSASPTSSPSASPPKLTASDGAIYDWLGYSVSVSGNTAVIGSFLDDDKGTDSGSAYVFQYNGAGWGQVAKLTASDGAAGDSFGYSVSISGNTAVIGSYQDDDKGSNSGSAYVFQYNAGTSWAEVAKLTASDGAANDLLGYSVSISGNTAVMGSPQDDDKGSNSGSAYVFQYNGTGWAEVAKLTASDGAAGDWLGCSVSISGNTAVIGSYQDDDKGLDSGAVYVFQYNGTGWNEVAKLTASDGAANDLFGSSVSVSGDTAVIGSYKDDDKGTDSGSVYVFQYNGTGWTEVAKLTASDGAAGDGFGYSVSISGNTAVIGSKGDDDKGSNSGSAYVFQYNATGWNEVAKLTAFDGAANDSFGYSVSVSGNTAVIGSYQDDDKGTNSGSVYVFSL